MKREYAVAALLALLLLVGTSGKVRATSPSPTPSGPESDDLEESDFGASGGPGEETTELFGSDGVTTSTTVDFNPTYDRCFIHKGCKYPSKPEFRIGQFGLAWYCSDRFPLILPVWPFLTPLDNCFITVGCVVPGGGQPEYNTSINAWICNNSPAPPPSDLPDQCYVVTGCTQNLVFNNNLNAWVCDDQSTGQTLDATSFSNTDACEIPQSCPDKNTGTSPVYNINLQTWYCSTQIDYDPCYIVGASCPSIYWNDGTTQPVPSTGRGWYCSDGNTQPPPGQTYVGCQIHTPCNGPVYDSASFDNNVPSGPYSQFGAWVCNTPAPRPVFN